MLNGKYQSSIKTPMGDITGTITLNSNPNSNNVIGTIETMGMKNNFNGMRLANDKCNFTGSFNTPIGNISYTRSRVVNQDKLELEAVTNKGSFKINGNRMKS